MKRKPLTSLLPDKQIFRLITESLTKIGYYQLTEDEKAEQRKLFPVKYPPIRRAKYANMQEVFRMDIKGYTIWFYSKYILKGEYFAPAGSFFFIVVKTDDPSGIVYYASSFHNKGDVVGNISLEGAFLVDRLRHGRPVSNGKRAEIFRDRENGTYKWVVYAEDNKTIIWQRKNFYAKLPNDPELKAHAYAYRDKRVAYAAKKKKDGKGVVGSNRIKPTKLPRSTEALNDEPIRLELPFVEISTH